MAYKLTMYDVYNANGEFIERCHLRRMGQILGCHFSSIIKRLKDTNVAFWKGYKVVRIKGVSLEDFNSHRKMMENEKMLSDYYNAIFRGLKQSGIAIGKHSIPPEEQIKRLKELGLEGSFRFIPLKEGNTRWFRIELIKT